MPQNAWSVDDEDTGVQYSAIPPGGRRRWTPSASLGEREDEAQHPATLGGAAAISPLADSAASNAGPSMGSVAPAHSLSAMRSSREAWPRTYYRALNVAFLVAMLAMGAFLGALVQGYMAPSSSPSFAPSQRGSTTTFQPSAVGGGPAVAARSTPTPDARFAVATLGIHCLLDPCDTTQYVLVGQRVYPLQGDVSCTITSAVEVVGHSEQYAYCRLDQPNVFTYAFNGAQFNCIGAWLGCHNSVQVDTTNGR